MSVSHLVSGDVGRVVYLVAEQGDAPLIATVVYQKVEDLVPDFAHRILLCSIVAEKKNMSDCGGARMEYHV